MLKVLLIAPENLDLPAIAVEIAAIVKQFDVKQVIHIVREVDIQSALEDGPYDIIWWATHGGPLGVRINGVTLKPEVVGDYVRASGADLCVLNTCASEEIAYLIIAGGKASMVYTITENIGDSDASRFAVLFSDKLAEMGEETDYRAAFNQAAGPSPEKYRFLESGQALRGLTVHATERMSVKQDEMQERFYELRSKVDVLTGRVDSAISRIDTMVAQNLQNQQQALLTQGDTSQIATLDRRLSRQPTSGFNPQFWATIGLIILILSLVLLYFGRFL